MQSPMSVTVGSKLPWIICGPGLPEAKVCGVGSEAYTYIRTAHLDLESMRGHSVGNSTAKRTLLRDAGPSLDIHRWRRDLIM